MCDATFKKKLFARETSMLVEQAIYGDITTPTYLRDSDRTTWTEVMNKQ
uniref:Uncharacterized protein n=1 Tax=Parascaris univalens TaxID=6257 RepID=A0A915C0N4_PARUN